MEIGKPQQCSAKKIAIMSQCSARSCIIVVVLYSVMVIMSIRWNELFLKQLVLEVEDNGDNPQNPMGKVKDFDSFTNLPDLHPASRDELWIKYGKYVLVRRMAFFDNRIIKPAIIINIMKHDRYRIHPRLYLNVVYNSNEQVCIPMKVWERSGVYRKQRYQYYVSYSLQTVANLQNTVPAYVMFTEDIYCKHGLSAKIPIYPHRKKKKFGVCLHQALYNIKKAQTIVDWIVIHQLMGVEIIFIYLEMKYEPEFLPKAIEPFVSSGLVELIDWSIGVETYLYGQFGVIQDCLYRSIGNVEYLALYDLDEILVPYKHMKWLGMVNELESIVDISKYASLTFENYVWHGDGKEIEMPYQYQPCSKISKPVFFKRTQKCMRRSPPKIMIRPAVVDSCWIHYVLNTKPNVYLEYSVPMSIGLIHHYKEHPNSKYLSAKSVFDDGMKRFVNGAISILNDLQCGQGT